MNRLYSRAGAFALSSALCLITVGRLSAQTTAAPSAAKPEDETPIVLSPFVVEAGEDTGYSATNTLAGTRVRTELKDVGSAIQVVTQKFMTDTNSKNSQDLLVYTTNTEVGGPGGNFSNLGNSAVLSPHNAATSPQSNTRVRGLDSADNTRDYFLSDIPWDGYIVGRVDIQRGANAVLFGIGSPAGIINSSINGASFKNQKSVEFRVSSFGSSRESLDINHVLIKDSLAIRFDAVNDETQYRQKPGYNHDHRLFGSVRFDPAFLNKGSAHTSFKVNFEKGAVSANRPDPTPPIDAITPWFTQTINTVKQWTYDSRTINTTDPVVLAASKTAGGINPANASYNNWINNGGAGGAIFDGLVAAFGGENFATPSDYFLGSLRIINAPGTLNTGTGQGVSGWVVYRGIQPYNQYARNAGLPSQALGVYKAKVITDPGLFDFYNYMIEGPNKHEAQKFDALDVSLSQTFFNNKLGFEAVFNKQNYYQEQTGLFGDATPWLSVEIMSILPDGRPNPNVGKAVVASRSNSNNSYESSRKNSRLTGTYELGLKEHFSKDSFLGSLLGKHVFTGLYQKSEQKTTNLSWDGQVVAPGFADEASLTEAARRMASVSYMGSSLIGKTISTANIPAISAHQTMTPGQAPYFNVANKPGVTTPLTLDDVVGWQMKPLTILDGNRSLDDRKALYSFTSLRKNEITSKVAIWQAYLLDGILVPTVSWRKDSFKSWDAGRAPLFVYPGQSAWGSDDPYSPAWKLPAAPDSSATGTSKSYSIVAHTPKNLRAKLPGNTDISLFYNKSDNFRPSPGDVDILGHSIASPSGTTKDYGITITTLDDKLTLKINWYKSSVKNARLTGDPGNGYAIGWGEGWAYMFARWAQLGIEGFSNNWALTNPSAPAGAGNPLIDPSVTVLRYQPLAGQTVAQALAYQNAAINAVIANEPPADFVNTWGIQRVSTKWDPTKGWGAAISPTYPNGLRLTGDTESKGVEYELTAQPTPQWSITANVSKTNASRVNLAQSFAVWVEGRYKLYTTTPYGNVRFWNGGNDQDSLTSFYQQFYGPYTLYRLQEGANVPELRPYHFNLITNYSFKEGALKNVNVGGSWRWANGIVTGYPIKNSTFDLEHPYKGPSETALDFWCGYERKLTNKIHWRIQLNVRNVFGKKELIPISVQPDGSVGASRIAEPRTWALTNTFKF